MKLHRLALIAPRVALAVKRRRRKAAILARARVRIAGAVAALRAAAAGAAAHVRRVVPPPRALLPLAQSVAIATFSLALVALTPRDPGAAGATAPPAPPPPATIVEQPAAVDLPVEQPWTGRSGRLLARLVTWEPGTRGVPGLYLLDAEGRPEAEPHLAVLPFRAKIGPYVGNYRLGYWPEERRRSYDIEELPAGFIEVYRRDVDVRISTHLTLGDFIVRDQSQEHVWPKYVVLREELIEKVELVIAELERLGIPASHVRVLSGFRSPEYNARGQHLGMAAESRHQYGDAIDLIIDADQDGRMDDLDGDGRVDVRDAMFLAATVERIESRHPDLVGGLGVYHAMGPSGPFVHIDVRGRRARWGVGAPREGAAQARASGRSWGSDGQRSRWDSGARSGGAVGRCYAEGASAVLCRGVN